MTKHIAAFGEVMMRMQVPGHELLIQSDKLTYSFSGTGVNIASALARLGHIGSVITTLPANALGDAAEAYLQKLGIQTPFIVRDNQFIGMYFLENGFGVRPSRVTYTNRQESSFNTADQELYNFTEIAKQIGMIHFCGITLAMNDNVRQQMKKLAMAVKEHGGTVVFDCNFRPSLWCTSHSKPDYKKAKPHYEDMLHLADIVMMNEKDARFILGMKTMESGRKEQLEELMPKVAKQYDIHIIAGTHRTIHENNTHSLTGFMYKNRSFHYSNYLKFSVLDRIGAGDAYTSGIIHGELTKLSEQEAVNFATAAAMLAHTTVGDTPLATEQEVLQALSGQIKDVER